MLRRTYRMPGVPEHGDVLVRAESVVVEAGGRKLLDGVDIGLRAGEVLALVGPNGAGKSTLLAALAGDLKLASGVVSVHGAPIGRWSTVELARLRAVLPQNNPLSFPFDVVSVVRMGRVPWAGTEAEDDDETEVAAALADTEMVEMATRRFSTLSGGEHARAALARVLAQSTSVLLLDEPTAAMDLRHQEQVLVLARAKAAAGAAVLVVLHDLGLAAAHADRIAVLSGGRIADIGPPDLVCRPDLLSDVYRNPVEVIAHPRTGKPIVLPFRN